MRSKIYWIGLIFLALLAQSCAPASAPNDTELPLLEPTPPPAETTAPLRNPGEPPPVGAEREFRTDFSRHTVPYAEILSGGPPKDGIPPIDHPAYVSIVQADEWLAPREPIILLEINGAARAYPLQILMWHEIVNDTLGGVPVAVTFCPLCNTAIVFERVIGDNETTTFGTTGRLRFSNLLMYDRLTETWWQQATGEAVIGALAGETLNFLPATIVAWETFKEMHPQAEVLSRETGFARVYGSNPYLGYDDVDRSPFLFQGPETPGQLPAMARVLTVELNGAATAYPYTVLEQMPVINDTVGNVPLVVFWQAGTASALDTGDIAQGRDVGAADTYARELAGRTLTFRYDGARFTDEETGSEWTFLGEASAGPLAGQRLARVVNVNHFWFSWAAFRPDTRIYSAAEARETAPTAPAATPSPVAVAVAVPFDFDIWLYQGAAELGASELKFSDAFAAGKPVLLTFWAGLCSACRSELPTLQEVYTQYGDAVVFVGLDVGSFAGLGNAEHARALLAELQATFPAGNTPASAVLREYQVFGVPETLLFSADGQLVERWSGLGNKARLEHSLQALLDAASGR